MLRALDLGQRKVKKKLMSLDLDQRKVQNADVIGSRPKEGKKKKKANVIGFGSRKVKKADVIGFGSES